MIVVKIELWPHGNEQKARLLGLAAIANDGTGTNAHGNYDIVLSHSDKFINKNGTWKSGRVEGFPRAMSSYYLVQRALNSVLGD